MATKQTIAELLVEIGVDAKDAEKAAERVKASLKKVGKAGEEADKGVTKSEKALKRFAKAGDAANKVANGIGVALAAVTATVGGLAKSVLTVGGRFEKLRAQLRTTTGSAEGAEKALRFIKGFAKETPFQVDQITQAFIKLNNFGIDPTERNLTAFGDFASAMGKSLNDFIEAITDATTGEFERLKEFGIKTKSEGDRVQFTFRGITTEVGKNAAEIQEFLTGLSEQNFGGAMAEQMMTAGGLISNLTDVWQEFLDQVANLGPLDEFKLLLEDLREAAGGRTGLAKQLAGVLVKAIRGVRRLLSGNLIPVLERLLGIIEFVINNFELLAAAFVAGKLISGVSGLATAFGGLGLSISALTGPVGVAIAALAALGIAAVAVTRQIQSIPKIPPPPGPVIDAKARALAPETAPKIEAAQEELQALRTSIARNPALDIESNRQRMEALGRRITRLRGEARDEESRRRVASGTGLEELERQQGAVREVTDLLLAEQGGGLFLGEEQQGSLEVARRVIEGGGTTEEAISALGTAAAEREIAAGGGRARRGGRRRRKRKGPRKKEAPVIAPTTVSQFFAAAARGDIGTIADRTPSTRDIEPTVAVDITNNNFNFRDTFQITGVTDPVETGKAVVRQIKAEFDMRLSNAGQVLPSNMVR